MERSRFFFFFLRERERLRGSEREMGKGGPKREEGRGEGEVRNFAWKGKEELRERREGRENCRKKTHLKSNYLSPFFLPNLTCLCNFLNFLANFHLKSVRGELKQNFGWMGLREMPGGLVHGCRPRPARYHPATERTEYPPYLSFHDRFALA